MRKKARDLAEKEAHLKKRKKRKRRASRLLSDIKAKHNQDLEPDSANAFPNSGDETVYTMLVVKPGNIDGGNTPSDVTFYVDDFAIVPN